MGVWRAAVAPSSLSALWAAAGPDAVGHVPCCTAAPPSLSQQPLPAALLLPTAPAPGKKKFKRNSRDALWQAGPVLLWGVGLAAVYLVTISELNKVRGWDGGRVGKIRARPDLLQPPRRVLATPLPMRPPSTAWGSAPGRFPHLGIPFPPPPRPQVSGPFQMFNMLNFLKFRVMRGVFFALQLCAAGSPADKVRATAPRGRAGRILPGWPLQGSSRSSPRSCLRRPPRPCRVAARAQGGPAGAPRGLPGGLQLIPLRKGGGEGAACRPMRGVPGLAGSISGGADQRYPGATGAWPSCSC
jgi:hypothetical protein